MDSPIQTTTSLSQRLDSNPTSTAGGQTGTGDLLSPTPATPGGTGDSKAGKSVDQPLDFQEVKGVTEGAFKDAYDYYKDNAVGDPKTRAQYLGVLRNELAEYKEGDDGKRELTRGVLKNFTDENYNMALTQGEGVISSVLQNLSEAKYTSFENFREAREKAESDFHVQFQSSVAYAELSEEFVKGLEDLSTKISLEFDLSDAEKEKEQLYLSERRKLVEQNKASAELQTTLSASQQITSNLETEKKLLMDQNEQQAREWKSRVDLESKLRLEQIARDLEDGFEDRAKSLQKELVTSNSQAMGMLMQMHKESRDSQEKLTQALLENRRHQQEAEQQASQAQQKPQGLLTALLSPVVGLVGSLLGANQAGGGGGLL